MTLLKCLSISFILISTTCIGQIYTAENDCRSWSMFAKDIHSKKMKIAEDFEKADTIYTTSAGVIISDFPDIYFLGRIEDTMKSYLIECGFSGIDSLKEINIDNRGQKELLIFSSDYSGGSSPRLGDGHNTDTWSLSILDIDEGKCIFEQEYSITASYWANSFEDENGNHIDYPLLMDTLRSKHENAMDSFTMLSSAQDVKQECIPLISDSLITFNCEIQLSREVWLPYSPDKEIREKQECYLSFSKKYRLEKEKWTLIE